MAGNSDPIFSRQADIQISPSLSTTAVTLIDGTGSLSLCFQADATNGGYLQRIRVKQANATATIAGVLRVFICNDTGASFVSGTTNTASNTALLTEITLPVFTSTSTTAAQPEVDIPINIALGPNHKVLVAIGASITGAIKCIGIGGKY